MLSKLKDFGARHLSLLKSHPVLTVVLVIVVVVPLGGFVWMGYRALRGVLVKVPVVGEKAGQVLPA